MQNQEQGFLTQFSSIFFGTLIIGIPLAIILALLVFLIPAFTVSIIFDAALFIPEKLGLVAQVGSDEIVEVSGGDEAVAYLTRKGRYRIYSEMPIATSIEIIFVSQNSDQIIQATSLYSNDSEARINVDEPQYVFQLEEPGTYTLLTTSLVEGALIEEVAYSVTPYVGNVNATIAIVGGVIQIGIIAFGIRKLYEYVYREHIQKEKALQTTKRKEWDDFMDWKNQEEE
jgi:hypothetical protein